MIKAWNRYPPKPKTSWTNFCLEPRDSRCLKVKCPRRDALASLLFCPRNELDAGGIRRFGSGGFFEASGLGGGEPDEVVLDGVDPTGDGVEVEVVAARDQLGDLGR